jgi:hypothetical protein
MFGDLTSPHPVELRGPPRLKIPIPPSNPQILNTHKEIWDQNELRLILDVWWLNNPAPVELRGPPALKHHFRIQTPKFYEPRTKIGTKMKLG